MTPLGKLIVRGFKPQTTNKGKETTRKNDLHDAFCKQNPHFSIEQKKCMSEKLSLDVIFYLNKATFDMTNYKKDLDNLLKILMDIIKEEMDDDKKVGRLGLVKNKDEDLFEITYCKKFVKTDKDEGINLTVFEFVDPKSNSSR